MEQSRKPHLGNGQDYEMGRNGLGYGGLRETYYEWLGYQKYNPMMGLTQIQKNPFR